MTVLTQSFESGTNGTVVSSSNTAGGGSAISTANGTGGTVTFTNVSSEIIAGSYSAKCYAPSGSFSYLNWSGSGTTGGFYAKHRLPAVTASGAVQIIRGTSGALCQAQLRSDGKISLVTTGGTLYTTPAALSLPGIYFIDITVDSGTSTTTGKAKFAVYDNTGAFAGGMTTAVEYTNINAGSGSAITFFQAGKCNNTTDTSNYVVDDMRAVTDVYGFAAPPTSTSTIRPTALVSNAGNWTYYGGAASINAAISDTLDTTGISSVANPSLDDVIVGFGSELAVGDVTVKVNARYNGAPGTITLQLLSASGTVIATGTALAVTGTLATYQLVLTGAQNSTLNGSANRTGLRLKITADAA